MTGMNPVLCIGARKYRNRLGTVIRLVVVGEKKREREREKQETIGFSVLNREQKVGLQNVSLIAFRRLIKE